MSLITAQAYSKVATIESYGRISIYPCYQSTIFLPISLLRGRMKEAVKMIRLSIRMKGFLLPHLHIHLSLRIPTIGCSTKPANHAGLICLTVSIVRDLKNTVVSGNLQVLICCLYSSSLTKRKMDNIQLTSFDMFAYNRP